MSGGFDPAALARMLRSMPEEQLAEGLRVNRDTLLEGVFARFGDHLTDAGRRERGAIKWKISGAETADGYDRWFVILAEGRCETGRELDLAPRVTFTVAPLDFLRLIGGAADPRRLWLTRRLGIRGDLLWAGRMPRFFRRPR
ncbi:MAG: SCP2 sterol-binding domain-containing protein [Solirubrobacterales bacterium]